jgi:hypothetical protein
MKMLRVLVCAFALLCGNFPLLAWGPTGHRVVGRVADRHLSKRAAEAIQNLLGQDTLAEVGTWADDIRADPKWDRAVTWHYVTVEDHETYETSKKNPQGDVIEVIRRFEAVLRNAKSTREEKAVAVKFLTHFIGDLHQPLHVGRGADRGGNGTQVSWFQSPTNLHAVWDNSIIESERLSFSEFYEFLDQPSDAEMAKWRSTGVLDWAMESFRARKAVYDIGKGKLGYEYAYRHLPFVKLRLTQAGIRLSGLLNSVFK